MASSTGAYGQAPSIAAAPPMPHRQPSAVARDAELLDERGLAGSRRPGDEHGSPSAGAHRAEQVGEDIELVLAADQALVERTPPARWHAAAPRGSRPAAVSPPRSGPCRARHARRGPCARTGGARPADRRGRRTRASVRRALPRRPALRRGVRPSAARGEGATRGGGERVRGACRPTARRGRPAGADRRSGRVRRRACRGRHGAGRDRRATSNSITSIVTSPAGKSATSSRRRTIASRLPSALRA